MSAVAGGVGEVPGDADSERLFTEAIVQGTPEAIAGWIALGPRCLDRLRRELSRERTVPTPEGASSRDLLDNLGQMSHEVAAAYPDEFLELFADDRWDGSPSVCFGLGAIKRPEVTERLMRILRSESHWLRIDAAVALRGHRHPDLEAAYTAALQDPDDLVRYHVEERLAELRGGSR